MKRSLALLLALLLVLTTAACGQPSAPPENNPPTPPSGTAPTDNDPSSATPQGEGVYGRVLELVIDAEPQSLDPHYSTALVEFMPIFHIFETPVAPDADGGYQPLVCEYAMNEEGTELTLTVREGVTFHDGTAVTSADVKASIDRWMAARKSQQDQFGNILTGCEVKDDKTVVYTFSSPAPLALSALSAMDYGAHIMKADFIATLEEGRPVQGYEAEKYIGTAPYRFSQWIPGQAVQLVRYDGYKTVVNDADGPGGTRYAYADGLNFNILSDPSTRAMNVMSGTLDYAAALSEELSKPAIDAGLAKNEYFDCGYTMTFVFNNSSERADSPIHDINFRRAILACLDMEPIILSYVNTPERVVLSPTFVTDGTMYDNDEIARDIWNIHDTEKAKEYLAQSSYKGEEIIWVTRSAGGNYYPSVVAAEQLGEIGINIKLVSVDTTTSNAYKEDFTGWDISCIQAPMVKTEPANFSFLKNNAWIKWDSPEKTDLYNQLVSTVDTAKRQEIVDRLTEILYYEEIPYIICGSYLSCYTFSADMVPNYNAAYGYFWNSYKTAG